MRDKVLLLSRRRCALCYADGKQDPQPGDIVHISHDKKDHTESNLVFVCLSHHAAIDKGQLSAQEIISARRRLYRDLRGPSLESSSRPRVFVVHGTDELAKNEVARFLAQSGLEPVILSERPRLGRSVLEKLEAADAKYAVVVLTSDDVTEASPQDAQERSARQNVMFELGYFMGRLGRQRVCALFKRPLVLPSDMHGVLYIEMEEAGFWRQVLTRELQAAGLPIRPIAAEK